jgi:hypothetical protein
MNPSCQDLKNLVNCRNILDSKPLQFIQLVNDVYKATNLMPSIIPKKMEWNIRNYRPDLIIYLGISIFLHRELFMIHDAYPRLLPFYDVMKWGESPEVENISRGYALENLKKLKIMKNIYTKLKTGEKLEWEDKNIIIIKKIYPMYPHEVIVEYQLIQHLDKINENVLIMKYNRYFTI